MSAVEHGCGSWLFVPGSRPDRFAKALHSGAAEVILDLEDAVAVDAKATARANVERQLTAGHPAWVRINAVGTTWHDDDVAMVERAAGLRGVVLPKAEDPDILAALASRLPACTMIVALVETARGVASLAAVAQAPGVARLALGTVDLALDLDAEPSDDALIYARGALVVASRVASLPGPLDGVTLEIDDVEVVARSASHAKRLGFAGKLCVHPRQVAAVNQAFTVSPADLDWARRVVAREDESEGAFSIDGKMIDRPLIERARRLLGQASG